MLVCCYTGACFHRDTPGKAARPSPWAEGFPTAGGAQGLRTRLEHVAHRLPACRVCDRLIAYSDAPV